MSLVDAPARRAAESRSTVGLLPFVLVGAVGAIARLWFIFATPLSNLSSDEAHTGIEALELLKGHVWTFVPGTVYGGNAEAWLDAPFAALLGPSAARLKIETSVLWFVAAVILAVAVRRHGRVASLVAFSVIWVPSAALLLHSTFSYPGYASGLAFAAVAVATATVLLDDEDPPARGTAAALGLASGLALWMHPFFFQVVLPVMAVVAWRHRRRVFEVLAPLAAGGALGLAVPLLTNLQNGFATLRQPPVYVVRTTYGGRVSGFFFDLFPRAVGMKWHDNARACRPGPWMCDGVRNLAASGLDSRWVAGPLGQLLAVAMFGLVAASAGLVLLRGSLVGRTCAVALIAAPFTMTLLAHSGYTKDGRYAEIVLPLAAVVAVQAVMLLPRQHLTTERVLAGIAVWACVALIFPSVLRLPHHAVDPDRDLKALARVLDDHGVTKVRAEYWIAYRLTYWSHERIVASPQRPIKFARYEKPVARAESNGTAALVIHDFEPVPPVHPPLRIDVAHYIVFLPAAA